MKKIIGMLITVMLLTGLSVSAEEFFAESEFDSILGTITDISENSYIIRDISGEEYRLNKDEESEILSDELMPVEETQIKPGLFARAVCKKMMTKSIPPQIYLDMLVVSDDMEKLPLYSEAAYIQTDADGNLQIETKTPVYVFTITDNTEIKPLKTRNILTKNDFSEGDRLFVYTKSIMLSEPAQAVPSKIVMIENKLHEIHKDGLAEAETNVEYLTREKFAVAVYDALYKRGLVSQTTEKTFFDDISDNRINVLAEAGIVLGTGNRRFMPDLPITKEETSLILTRIVKKVE